MKSLITIASSSGYAMFSLPDWLELASIVVGSLSGLIVARERRFDLIGYIGLALICGLGGGLIRDTMMQRGGVYMIDSRYAILTSIITSVLVFFVPRPMERFPKLIEWVDIIAVGLFAAVGTDKAMVYGLNPLSAVLMGIITGVGGGMLRDVFLGEVPRIFQESNFYAVCAIGGATVYWICASLMPRYKIVGVVAGTAVTVLLRRLSLRYNVKLPVGVDFSHEVAHPIETLMYHGKKAASHEKDAAE